MNNSNHYENIKKLYNFTVDPLWDNKLLNYQTSLFNWAETFLSLARESKPDLINLESIHLFFQPYELVDLRKKFERYTNSKEFSRSVDSFIEKYIEPLIPDSDYMIQQTAGIRIVIPNQQKTGRLLTFHTGYWTGYNNSMYTTWIPLTKAYDSNSMQVLSWDDSKEIMLQLHKEQWSLNQTQSICESKCWPVNANYGQAWLFNQGHLHGNINNATDVSRVSFDIRVALKGEDFGPRRAGSFYRFKGYSAENNLSKIDTNRRWITYVDQNCEYIDPTPHYMIREFLLQYAKSYNITPTDWKPEYWHCPWMPHFVDLLTQGNVDGIILPSIYAFSLDEDKRIELFKLALDNDVQLLFADENLLLNDYNDLERIVKIYDFIKK